MSYTSPQSRNIDALGEPAAALQPLAWPRLGFVYVLTVPLVAAIATGRGMEIAGFNYTGWLWVIFLGAGTLLILTDKALHRPERIALPHRPWLVWFGFVWFSLVWCEDISRRNVQDAAQLSMPLLVGAAASLFVRTPRQLSLLLRAFVLSLIPLAASVLIARSGEHETVDMLTGLRPLGLTASLVGCIFLARLPERFLRPLVGWLVCLVLCFAAGGRTTTAVLILVLFFNPLVKRIGARIVLGAAIALLALGVFYTPQFQSRFFYSGSGTLGDLFRGDIRGAGRFDAWPQILDEALRHPVIGTGVGSAYDFVPKVWFGMNHVHNDYLRIFFEFGLVGLVLFAGVMCWQMSRLWRDVHRTEGIVRYALAAAFLGMLIFLLNATTGNPLGYNIWFMNPLFALMGAAYGVIAESPAPSLPPRFHTIRSPE